jgi:hypothetical protein
VDFKWVTASIKPVGPKLFVAVYQMNLMDINSDFGCGKICGLSNLAEDQWPSLTFSQIAFLAAEEAEPFCDPTFAEQHPFTFVVPTLQMFGSINRRFE